MATIILDIDRKKLPRHTDDEFQEWVEYEVGDTGHINLDNPLVDTDLEALVLEIND